MTTPSCSLLTDRRFLPLFCVQFLGAFNDNIFRFALLTLITYEFSQTQGFNPASLSMFAAGLFILPFLLFSATAGLLADRYSKTLCIRHIKFFELLIMLLAAWALNQQWWYLLFFCLALTGLQSALFGPVKYAILPQLLSAQELLAGNAWVTAGTFISVLMGTMLGGLLVMTDSGRLWVSIALCTVALFGYCASFLIPKTRAANDQTRLSFNIFTSTARVISNGFANTEIRRVMLAISCFWLFAYVIQSQLAPMCLHLLAADESVTVLFLTLFTIGIASGCLLCNRWLKGKLSLRWVPLAAAAMSIFCFDLYFFVSGYEKTTGSLLAWRYVLIEPIYWRLILDIFFIAVAAGFYIVPLYSHLQSNVDEGVRAQVMAANNILNALFMVTASIVIVIALSSGLDLAAIFFFLGLFNLIGMLIMIKNIRSLLTALDRLLLRLFFRYEVRGLEHYPKDNTLTVIIANHVSLLDGPLLVAALPELPVFAINREVNQKWWVSLFTRYYEMFPLDSVKPMAIKSLIKMLRQGRKVVIFPEGRISNTDHLMKLYDGPGKIADIAGAQLLPVRIDGAQYTTFGHLRGVKKLRWFNKVTVTICKPQALNIAADLQAKLRLIRLRDRVYEVMTEMMLQTSVPKQTLFQSLQCSVRKNGASYPILEDINHHSITLGKTQLASLVLANALRSSLQEKQPVGVLLPNTIPTAVCFYALQAQGRVAAMLNFSAGRAALRAAIETAEIKQVITSKRFIALAELDELIVGIEDLVDIVYLEEVKDSISLWHKLAGLITATTGLGLQRDQGDCHAAAVILFTSGSEGMPKAVVLSHHNLLSNQAQVNTVMDFVPQDCFFNALPLFHSFGLGVGLILPVVSGIRTFLYPTPLHFKQIPDMVYDTQATVIFGTDTFLSSYAKHAAAEDFKSLRYVIAGAEKLKASTRDLWLKNHGKRIHEGYGLTETSPALSINTDSYGKEGSVGKFLPGVEYRLEKVAGIEQGQRLWVRGANVMLGYMKHESPAVLQAPVAGWHDSGDIVSIDAEGFLHIVGRAKRFAKIAGEMISLAQLEQWLAQALPESEHCLMAVEDERKGERLVLLTTAVGLQRQQLQAIIQSFGGSELMLPRSIIQQDNLPLLGSGKFDYATMQKMAEAVTR